jgi:polyhydroxyalkanoate synthesis regulator phasin
MSYEHGDHCLHRWPQCSRCYDEAVAGAMARRIYLEDALRDAERWRDFSKRAQAQHIDPDKIQGVLDEFELMAGEKQVLQERVFALEQTVQRLEAAFHHRPGQDRR